MSQSHADFQSNRSVWGIIFWLNGNLAKRTPAEIIVMTLVTLAILKKTMPALYSGYRHINRFGVIQSAVDLAHNISDSVSEFPATTKHALVNLFFNSALRVPKLGPLVAAYGQEKVETELKGIVTKNFARRVKHGFTQLELPDNKQSADEILRDLDKFLSLPAPGKQSGAIYTKPDLEMLKLLDGVSGRFAFSNITQTEVFPECSDMEAQVIAWMTSYFKGNYPRTELETKQEIKTTTAAKSNTQKGDLEKVKDFMANTSTLYKRLNKRAGKKPMLPPGLVTSGGTESNGAAIWMAVAAARDRGIERPEIIVPDSIHTSFDNMADKFHAKLIRVPVNPETGQADVDAMRRKINDNTCLMAGSAPSFPKGVCDPIDQLARLAKAQNIPFHMDACIGFPQVFAERAGFNAPYYGFHTEGVTSISCDTHKYCFTTKDSSVVMFNHQASNAPKFKAHGHFNWMGGLYVAPFAKGSRSGRPVAEAYAVMRFIGDAGYLEIMKKIFTTTRELEAKIKQIPGIRVPFPTQATIIAIDTNPEINSHLVASYLTDKGWVLNVLMPTGFHFCVTGIHPKVENFVQIFCDDLKKAIEFANYNRHEQPTGIIKAYGTLSKKMQATPDIVKHELAAGYIAANNTIPVAPNIKLRR